MHKSSRLFALLVFLMSAIWQTVYADPTIPEGNATIHLPTGQTIVVQAVVLSIILFISGAYLAFFGAVHQKLTMFIVGFYVGANVAYIILRNAKADYGDNTYTILLVVSIVVGVLAGLLLSCCWFLAVYLVGALLGYLFALWILSWADNGAIQSYWGRAILILVMVIVGAILMHFLERPMMIVATSFIGSFAIFCGIDLYANTGFLSLVDAMLQARSVDAALTASSGVRGMLGGCLALTVVAILIQWCQIRGRTQSAMRWRDQHPAGQYGWKRV